MNVTKNVKDHVEHFGAEQWKAGWEAILGCTGLPGPLQAAPGS